jgi:hypothetical protein
MTNPCTWVARSRRASHPQPVSQIYPTASKSQLDSSRRWREIFERLGSACVQKEPGTLSARTSKTREDGSDDGVFGRWRTSKAHAQLSVQPASPSVRHILTSLRRPCGGLSRAKSGLDIVFQKYSFFTVCVQKENVFKTKRRPPIFI